MALPVRRRSRGKLGWQVLLLVVFLIPRDGGAQMPGSWQLVYTIDRWQPYSMQFADSAYGIILADTQRAAFPWRTLRTTDAGATWQSHAIDAIPRTDSAGWYAFFQVNELVYHNFDLPTRSDAYCLDFDMGSVSHDSGTDWTPYRYVDALVPNMAGQRIFSTGTGFKIATLKAQSPLWETYSTHDSAKSFQLIVPQEGQSLVERITDAIFLDTLEFWASSQSGSMYRTTDGGRRWSKEVTFPGLGDQNLNSREYLKWIMPSQDPKRFYVLFDGFDTTWRPDYIETTDNGVTWRVDSSFGGPRIYRLVSPSSSMLWAFVGRRIVTPVPASLSRSTMGQFADSLFFSSDDGITWYNDGTTFAGDTLCEMRWPDSTHGYITAWRDSTLLIYRWSPSAAGISASASQQSFTLKLLELPVQHTLSFTCIGHGSAQIFIIDALGRERIRTEKLIAPTERVDFPLLDLTPGCYWLVVRSVEGTECKAFVKW